MLIEIEIRRWIAQPMICQVVFGDSEDDRTPEFSMTQHHDQFNENDSSSVINMIQMSGTHTYLILEPLPKPATNITSTKNI